MELALAKAGPEKPMSFSKVGSTVALRVFSRLGVSIHDGNKLKALVPPKEGFVKCAEFDMSDYGDERTATPDFLRHIQHSLQRNGVKFGNGGFDVLDLHENSNLYELAVEVGDIHVFRGVLDGAVVPYGASCDLPQDQIRCGIEIKHSSRQKAQHKAKQHNLQPSGTEQGIEYAGTVQGQVMMEQLAAIVYAEYPQVMLLLSSCEHNTILLWDEGVVTVWKDITFDAAMFKVAQFLRSCDAALRYELDTAVLSEQHKATIQLRNRLRTDCPLLEQLDSLTLGMSRAERHAAALEFFRAYRPHMADLGMMFS